MKEEQAVKQPQNSEKRVIGRPFPPGVSGNPKGRPPKAWTMASLIEEALEEQIENSGGSVKKEIARKLAKMALAGDIQAIKEVNDRIDGKPKQAIDHTTNGKDVQPLLVKFINDESDRNTD